MYSSEFRSKSLFLIEIKEKRVGEKPIKTIDFTFLQARANSPFSLK